MKKLLFFASLVWAAALIFTACGTTDKIEKPQTSEETVKEPEVKDPPNVAFAKDLQKHLNANDLEGAIKTFENMPNELKTDTDLKLVLASLYVSSGDYNNASAVANEILATDPNNMSALEVVSVTARASGDKKTYNQINKKILQEDPFNAQANILAGQDYALNKKYKLARDCYSKALQSEPENPDALYGYTLMSYYQDDVKTAKQTAQKLLSIDPKNPSGLSFMGKIAAEEYNYIKAIKYAQDAIKYEPDNYNYYLDLGKYYRATGKFDEATETWTKATELQPDYFLAYAYLAGCYDEQNQYDLAIYNYQKVIDTNPQYYYAYESIAVLEYHMGRYDDSIKHFLTAYSYYQNYSYKLMVAAMYYQKKDSYNGKKYINELLKTLERDSAEYNLVRMFGETYSRNAATTLIQKINKEDNSNKKGKMLFYMGLYFETFGAPESAVEYYTKVASMQAPMFFEYRLAEWGLGLYE